jgi:hypothetical protein
MRRLLAARVPAITNRNKLSMTICRRVIDIVGQGITQKDVVFPARGPSQRVYPVSLAYCVPRTQYSP